MTLQTDLRNVTDVIVAARKRLADREFERMAFERNARQAKQRLDTEMALCMAHSEAGNNETQRRAYAILETANYRNAAKDADNKLTEAEAAVLEAATVLRSFEDERRYLELVARMTIAGVVEVSPVRETSTYANDDDNQNGEDNFFYSRDVADALARVAR